MLFHACLYYLSFLPLWILIIINEIFRMISAGSVFKFSIFLITVLLLLVVYSCLVVFTKFDSRKKVNTRVVSNMTAKEDKFSVAEFMMSFVFPFWAFDFSTFQGMISFSVIFLSLGFLCIKHRYFCCNIVLEIWGYRIYECEYTSCVNSTEIIKKKVLCKKNLQRCLGNNLIEKNLSNDYSLIIVEE